MMDVSPAIPRLGIPEFHWWNEALHGIGRNGIATVFPITMGMAATFNDHLVYQAFSAASDEARAKNTEARRKNELIRYRGYRSGHLTSISSVTHAGDVRTGNVWRRPYLTSRMGVAVVKVYRGRSIQANLVALRNTGTLCLCQALCRT